jgi:autotransporter-associated beta strand protein
MISRPLFLSFQHYKLPRRTLFLYPACLLAFRMLLGQSSSAATLFWDGDGAGAVGGGNGTWDLASARWSLSSTGSTYQTWSNSSAPADDAVFQNSAGTVSLGDPITVRSITARTPGYVLTGSTLTFADGSGVIDVGTASTVSLTVNSIVNGSVGLTKQGLGALTLNAANSFTGGTTITSGTLNVGNDLALSSGAITLGGGTLAASGAARTLGNTLTVSANSTLGGTVGLTFNGAATLVGNRTLTVSNTATTFAAGLGESGGASNFTKAGAGTLFLNAASTYTGTTTLTGGTLALGPAGTISAANLVLRGGVLATQGTFNRALGNSANQVRWTGAGGFVAFGGNLSITGFTGTPVWGTTANFVPNARALILGTAAAGNVVNWTNDFSLGTAVRTISVNDNSTSTTDRAVISGVISSGAGGALNRNGSGRLDLTAANTYTGATNLQGGITGITTLLDVGAGPSSLGAPATAAAGTIGLGSTTAATTLLYTGAGATTDRVLNLAGTTGAITLQNDGTGALIFTSNLTATGIGTKTLTLAGNNTGANELRGVLPNSSATGLTNLAKSGNGTWLISAANTYNGTTTLSAGTLVAGNNSAFGTGALLLSGAGTTLRTDGIARTLTNPVSLRNSMTIGGTANLTFSGVFSQTGSRTLSVTNTGATTFSGPAFVLAENNQARTLTVAAAGGPVTISGVAQDGPGTGGDSITKTGAGTLVLSGLNTYTGTTSIRAGSVVTNTLANLSSPSSLGAPASAASGTIALGSAATTGTLVYTGGATSTNRAVNLAGTTGGGVLDASGSGALTFTSAFTATGAGSKLLTLTGNSSAANTIAGAIVNNSATNLTRVNKTGTGTWVLSGANTFTGNLTVSAGTLRIGANNVLPDTASVILAGGTLDVTGRIDTAGTLNLSANSTIDFGASAAAIVFAASNGLTWSGATLTISNYTTGVDSLRFGSGASALTATQLGRFRFAGFGNAAGQIDAFGFVTPVPEPAAFAVLAGLAAFGVAFRRRRRSCLAAHPCHGAR